VERVGGGRSTQLAGHVAWPAGHHLVPNRLVQVSGDRPRPYKYPPTMEMRRHAPHLEYSICKALILSVVVRHSLDRRVARL
jgi:hypothetical protein